MKANLHTHTIHSDGVKTVEQMLSVMKSNGMDVVSITDHNAIDGTVATDKYCKQNGIECFNGVELTSYPDDGLVEGIDSTFAMHMLGYGFDLPAMQEHLDKYETRRQQMLTELIKLLTADGYPISIEGVHGPFPHVKDRASIAWALVRAGCAESVNTAFDSILNTSRYVEYTHFPLPIGDTIAAIHKAGGLAIWAHPYILKRGGNRYFTDEQVEIVLRRLIAYGLDGIEAYYLQFDERQIAYLERLAEKYELLTSTGSDYHGKDAREDTLLEQDKTIEAYTAKCMPLIEKLRSGNR